MLTNELYERQARAVAFAAEHLAQCAAELIEMNETSVLPAGRVRELAELCSFVGSSRLTYAINEVQRQVLQQHVAQAQEKKAFSATSYAQQQIAVAQARDEELREDSQSRLAIWFYHGGTAFHELTLYGIAAAAWEASRVDLAEQVQQQLEDAGESSLPAQQA